MLTLMVSKADTMVVIVVVMGFLLLAIFIYAGVVVRKMAREKLTNQPLPVPMSDHEAPGWKSSLLYEDLKGEEEIQKLLSYTMSYINAKGVGKNLLHFATEKERHSAVSRMIRVTTLPSFNGQYKRELTLSDEQIEEVVVGVLRLLSR